MGWADKVDHRELQKALKAEARKGGTYAEAGDRIVALLERVKNLTQEIKEDAPPCQSLARNR